MVYTMRKLVERGREGRREGEIERGGRAVKLMPDGGRLKEGGVAGGEIGRGVR